MDSTADWSETPPEQVGPDVLAGAIVEDETKAANLSSGLSDVVDEIDLHAIEEDDILKSPPPSVPSQDAQDTQVDIVVSVRSGLLPEDLPPTTVALDDRVHVPEVSKADMTSNDLEMTSNGSESTTKETTPPATSTTPATTTTSAEPMMKVPTSTPQTIWTHTRPNVMANLQAGRPALAAPVLLGDISDYAAAIPRVEKWKYVPNPVGTVRMPVRVLEQHIRERLSAADRTRLQMSAHRKVL